MRFGIHLPQYGKVASPAALQTSAVQAEDLGFADVWVGDLLGTATDSTYPPAKLRVIDPFIALTWAAAVTRRVRLGTSVIVLPYRTPVPLAQTVASLDLCSEGRVILGVGVGHRQVEFDAVGALLKERGARSDEMIQVMRACWETDPVVHHGRFYRLDGFHFRPQPRQRIPVWVGGRSEAALSRALQLGDGWEGSYMTPEEARPLVDRLRQEAPPGFVVSMRTAWDGIASDLDEIRRHVEAFAEVGVDHIMAAPGQRELDDWRRSVEVLHGLFTEVLGDVTSE